MQGAGSKEQGAGCRLQGAGCRKRKKDLCAYPGRARAGLLRIERRGERKRSRGRERGGEGEEIEGERVREGEGRGWVGGEREPECQILAGIARRHARDGGGGARAGEVGTKREQETGEGKRGVGLGLSKKGGKGGARD